MSGREDIDELGIEVVLRLEPVVALEEDLPRLLVGEGWLVRAFGANGVLDVGNGYDSG